MQKIQLQTVTQDQAAYNRNAQKIIEKLKANDIELIDATLEYAVQIFNSNEPPLKKLLILRVFSILSQLIKDAILIKSGKFINKYIQTRPLMTFIGNICTHKLGDSNLNRGADLFYGQDSQSSIEFLNLALQLVEFLATTFPKDSKGAPTKFKIQYDELVQMGVKFPPQSSLILPLDPNIVSQKQQNNNKERDETMLKLNESKQTIYQDIEMINETLVNNFDMGYINEVLVNLSESMNFIEKQFASLIYKANEYEGVLSEDELAELHALQDFVKKFQIYYYAFLEQECSSDAYNQLKKRTLAHIQKIQNKDFDNPPPQQYKQTMQQQSQQFQSQFQNEDEMLKKAIEESKMWQQNSQIQQKQFNEQKKLLEINKQQEDQHLAKLREEQIKQEQSRAEEQRRENERKEKEKQEQIRYEQIRQEQVKQEQLRLEENRKGQLKLEQVKSEQKRSEAIQQQQSQMKQKEIENYWNNQFQTPNPDNQQYITLTKLGSNTIPQKQQQQAQSFMESSFQQKKSANQQQNGIINTNYMYSTVNQQQKQAYANQFEQNNNNFQQFHDQNTREQLPMNHITSNIGKRKEFDENFDGLSQSTLTQSFFPLKMDQQIPIKQYIGKFVKYDNTQFELLHMYGLTESQKKRFKIATIKGRATLVNSPQLQVGIKQELQYVPLKEKIYLKLTLYIGNKTQSNFDSCKIQFEGDSKQFSMWLKPDKMVDKIEAGQQIQQEVIGIFKQYENYRLVNVLFASQWANKQISSNFFLTTTLVSFMDFKDISLQIFRTKWRQKKTQILRGETFILNPKIVKTGNYLRKIFPKLCEFNSYQLFQDQQLDYFRDRQFNYISYKLCGIFELTNVNQNYMIKFIVLPNMQCTIQIIGNNEPLCKQLLSTLHWILGLE
ncbi:unnamed protein product (macronuclear) [Paramecium tetraurelia]|uniref:Uncharacterized protein n=1 Tax=Paramecium tetraurelia TaxID=5888 RepID=A0E5J6_PARTE|nr:uncharacterized protein GSPATT00003424001 [Paramecium tetraurelia]CAK90563.1 unnamed protein product [Paramecium tetraurelia]|eukprot:XP_001457960.1 hypothetical protein (macronuclear) [Paramecium tetraurelia strain d4-2]